MAIAQRLNTVIISADSRQVYRDFDIGTAKPSIRDRQLVPHYLIDCCDPTETLTLADYQTRVEQVLHHHDKSHSKFHEDAYWPSVPLLVGGTGLYIKAIVRGLKIPRVPPNLDLRSQLAALGQSQCYEFLQQVDAASAERIHPNDQVRTLRALEVYYTTGIPMTDQQGESPPPYPVLQLGVDCFAEGDLTRRIQQRTHQMVASGFVDEVASLCDRYGADLPLLDTLGYREMRQYLAGAMSLPEAIAQTVTHTRQFAKRQRTWFRADDSIEWLEATDPHLVDCAWDRIQQFLQRQLLSRPPSPQRSH